ncbi:RagB/SusD family nutrient uptake outer membrane protein [Pedobacter sp. HDW13]|uniref:RagB/SusD family nutrient uptake outer membrane protein n=1 Tax=unclassified Pedobacter TaxID=2628915 RepID=UPI000F591DD0|nr:MULTISPECIES: RagB/SusD family nutrient uptake outer membrane protein [unclassified Pedobacter]QIL40308.1 RagB/SusD family nutrient uptake outer membrane protein [Pedobacter sp. HDW13]RQO79483.1 RagB/SusD family nutrient uptake outer membrane protein [Pedobacter sp. KBW01]
MNSIYKKIVPFVAFAMLLTVNGCKKSDLDSELLSQLEPQTALTSVAAMKAALAGIGANVRREFTGDMAPIVTESIFSEVAVDGTTDKTTQAQDMDTRVTPDANLDNPDFNRIGFYWTEGFRGVRMANTVITYIDNVTFKDEAERNAILGAAYFYRAYYYYRLVHQFGDVPLNLKDITTPKLDYYSTKREVILKKMQEDLLFAEKWVKDNVDRGEVTKGACSHLLTKVNLALGDFDAAITSANNLINGGTYSLMRNRFGSTAGDASKNVVWDLHRMDNKAIAANREALFLTIDRETLAGATDLGSQVMRNCVPAWHFANLRTPSGTTQAIVDGINVEIPLTLMYGRGIGRYRGTAYSTKNIWTDNTDYRHAPGMWMNMTDLVYNNPAIKTASNVAERALYGKPLVDVSSANVNNMFLNKGLDTIRHFFGWPHYKTFINSTNALAADKYWSPPRGTNTDWYIFRLAETYLLRAEAYYWKGNLALAMADLNQVRSRANAALLTDASAITIGTILDERARELFYEEPRKTELTRIAYIFATTGKPAYNGKTYNMASFSDNNFFYDRIIEKNDFYRNKVPTVLGVNFKISPYHVLWPVPAAAQRFNTEGRINQNKGYSGYENNVPALDKIQ